MTTPTELRETAARHEAEAVASFERSDTDGFLSQWASGLSAQRARLAADILDAGGTHKFLALFNLAGGFVPAKTIETRFGKRWMVLDADGRATGTFLPFLPKRRDTLAKRGFVEGHVLRPAAATINGKGYGLSGTAWVEAVPTDKPHHKPTSVVTADRWAPEPVGAGAAL